MKLDTTSTTFEDFAAAEFIDSSDGEPLALLSPKGQALPLPAIDVEKVRELAAQGNGADIIARLLGTTRGRVGHVFLKYRIPRNGHVGPRRQVIPAKPCRHCGRPFERRENEGPRDFRARRFCSWECSGYGRHLAAAPREWKPAEVAKLQELVAAGYTAQQIANEFGATRNSIIGLARRNGLNFGDRKSGTRVARPNVERPKRIRVKAPTPPVIMDADIPFEQRVAFLDLQPHHCKWPIGDLPNMMFCGGERMEKGPYCATHDARAHRCEPSTRPASTFKLEARGFTTERRRIAAVMAWAKHKSQQRVGI